MHGEPAETEQGTRTGGDGSQASSVLGHPDRTAHADDSGELSFGPGTTLGRYEILESLGRGGMGVVMRAFDPVVDRHVAIKLLHRRTSERAAERLRREAQAMAMVSHPNIVQVFEVGQARGRWFLVMQLVKGSTLENWQGLERGWRRLVGAYLEAGEGLAAAHAAGLVHRDFKPANCLVDEQGHVRVADFGLVRDMGGSLEREALQDIESEPSDLPSTASSSSRSLTRSGTVLGTRAYMALEQHLGRPADARSDQFSFCVALYEALYSERPFDGRTSSRLLRSLMSDEVRPAPRGSRVPPRLRAVLVRGLAREPDERWPSMEALLSGLRDALDPWHARPAVRVGGPALAAAGLLLAWSGWGRPGPGLAEDASRCAVDPQRLDGHWGDAQRERVRAAVLGTELPYAEDAWRGAAERIDDFGQRWISTQSELCESILVRHERPREAFDASMVCLREQRDHLDELVDVLGDGDEQTVRHAVEAADALPDPAECESVSASSGLEPPEDQAARVAELRRELSRVSALESAGQLERAARDAAALLEDVEPIGFDPLTSRVQLVLGGIERQLGRPEDAEHHLSNAYFSAREQGREDLAIDAALELATLLNNRDLERTREWLRHVGTGLERGEGSPGQRRSFHNVHGLALLHEGELTRAGEQFERSLELARSVPGAEEEVMRSLNNLAVVRYRQEQMDRAVEHMRDLLVMRLDALGPSHPAVAIARSNLASALVHLGDIDEAIEHLEEARRIKTASHGADSLAMASVLHNLGNAYAGRGDVPRGLEAFERSIEIYRGTGGDPQIEYAHLLNDYAGVLMDDESFGAAQRHFEEALGVLEQVLGESYEGSAHPVLFNLGDVHRRQGQPERALEYYARAEAQRVEVLGEEHVRTALARGLRAYCLVELGKLESAVRPARRALDVLDPDRSPVSVARGRFVLARTKWPRDRDEATAEARRALETLAAKSSSAAAERLELEIQSWLDEHD